jgi:hypothetical protein
MERPASSSATAYAGSGEVAELVASAVRNHMRRQTNVDEGVGSCGDAAADLLTGCADGASTLIVVAADPSGFISFGIAGNGALSEVELVEPIPGRHELRVNELTFSQMSYERGRPALRSFLPSPPNGLEFERGTRRLASAQARLFIACTDGLVTEDSPRVLPDATGGLWREVAQPFAALLEPLRERWSDILETSTPERDLATLLQTALETLARDSKLDDDATVGAVLVRPRTAARSGS